MAYITTEVEVDLDEFSDDELLEEIERRNIQPADGWVDPDQTRELIHKMYEKVRLKQDISEELRDFFWRTIGRSL